MILSCICAFICIFISTKTIFVEGNPLKCGAPWEIDWDDNNKYNKPFQSWISNWQNDDSRCNRTFTHFSTENSILNLKSGGICAGLIFALKDFVRIINMGLIFRPNTDMLWSDLNRKYCTHEMRGIDCYFKTLSNCNMAIKENIDNDKNLDYPLENKFPDKIANLCDLGARVKKPIQWVLGNLLEYMIRPKRDIEYIVKGRVAQIMDEVKNNTGIIAIQIRTGVPNTEGAVINGTFISRKEPNGRHVIDLDRFIQAVDSKAKEYFEQTRRNISIVYVTSQSNVESFVSIKSLNDKYNKSYKILFLNQYPVENSSKDEIEWILTARNSSNSLLISRFHIMAEMLADLEIFSLSDIFIGSYSSVYAIGALLRYSRNMKTVHQTCILHYISGLLCEGGMGVVDFWRTYFRPAFIGGSYRK